MLPAICVVHCSHVNASTAQQIRLPAASGCLCRCRWLPPPAELVECRSQATSVHNAMPLAKAGSGECSHGCEASTLAPQASRHGCRREWRRRWKDGRRKPRRYAYPVDMGALSMAVQSHFELGTAAAHKAHTCCKGLSTAGARLQAHCWPAASNLPDIAHLHSLAHQLHAFCPAGAPAPALPAAALPKPEAPAASGAQPCSGRPANVPWRRPGPPAAARPWA